MIECNFAYGELYGQKKKCKLYIIKLYVVPNDTVHFTTLNKTLRDSC